MIGNSLSLIKLSQVDSKQLAYYRIGALHKQRWQFHIQSILNFTNYKLVRDIITRDIQITPTKNNQPPFRFNDINTTYKSGRGLKPIRNQKQRMVNRKEPFSIYGILGESGSFSPLQFQGMIFMGLWLVVHGQPTHTRRRKSQKQWVMRIIIHTHRGRNRVTRSSRPHIHNYTVLNTTHRFNPIQVHPFPGKGDLKILM